MSEMKTSESQDSERTQKSLIFDVSEHYQEYKIPEVLNSGEFKMKKFDNFCLSEMQISEHCQESKILEVVKFRRI